MRNSQAPEGTSGKPDAKPFQLSAELLKNKDLAGSDEKARAADSLSSQEKRVLALVANGKTNKEIAIALGLSGKTVKNYLSTIFRKLGVGRRALAAVIYRQSNPK